MRPDLLRKCSFHNRDSAEYLQESRDDRTDTELLSPRHHRRCHQTHRRRIRLRSIPGALGFRSTRAFEAHLVRDCYILP